MIQVECGRESHSRLGLLGHVTLATWTLTRDTRNILMHALLPLLPLLLIGQAHTYGNNGQLCFWQ